MMLNKTQNAACDPRSFFYYNGDYYINGTEIILKDDYINQHQFNGKKIWKYARFDHQVCLNGRVAYFFCINKSDWLSLYEMGLDTKASSHYAPYFIVEAINVSNIIEEISKPIKLERHITQQILEDISEPKSDFDNPDLVLLWAVYIIIMICSLIFNHFYIVWAIVSYLFVQCRKEMMH